MKKTVKKLLSGAIKGAAITAAGTASWQGHHQPKEPAALKKLKK